MDVRRVFGRALSLALIAGALSASPQSRWQGTIVEEGAVTVVQNSKEPLHRTPILELEEELALGGPEAEGDSYLGLPWAAAVDEAGSIFALDLRNDQVKVFDASGRYVRTIGRRGQGPGELERVSGLSLNARAGELAIPQEGRVSHFKTDGTFLRSSPFKGMRVLNGEVDARGFMYVLDLIADDRDSRYETKKLAPDASVLAVIGRAPGPFLGGDRMRALGPMSYFTIDRTGSLVYGYPETYEIRFLRSSDSAVFRIVRRDYDPVAVSDEEKKTVEREASHKGQIRFDFPKNHSAYIRFFLSDSGHLFVQTWEKTRDGRSIHDVFDAQGRFIGRVPLRGKGIEISKGKYYALEEDEDGYQYVKRYAVTWKVK